MIIELVKIEDHVVSDEAQGITPEVRTAIEGEKAARAPRLNFNDIGVPVGSVLTLSKDPKFTCEVASATKVMFRGELLSPSAAALRAVHELGYNWPTISGSDHWAFEGVKLSTLRGGKPLASF